MGIDVLTAASPLHLLECVLHAVGAGLVTRRSTSGPQVGSRHRHVRAEVVEHRAHGGAVIPELVRLQDLPDRGKRTVEVEGEAPIRDRQYQCAIVPGDLGDLRQPVDQVGYVLDDV